MKKPVNNKLALTGVTGYKSGRTLAEHISLHIDDVLLMFQGGVSVICRKTSHTDTLEQLLPNARICRGSFEDSEFLTQALVGVDTLLHVAGIHHSRKLVDAAIRSGVRRIILVHTTGIYSKYKEAGEEYRLTDAYVEEQCAKHGTILTILRPTMIYGNIHDQNVVKFIRMVDKLPVMPVVNDARYELQPVHYKDLGKAYFDVLMNESATANKNYDLSGGEVIYLRDMLEIIGHNLGKDMRFASCPYIVAYVGAWCLYGMTLGRIDYREKVQRLCEPRVYGHEEASRDFGYAPRSFRDGIVDEVKEYLAGKS